MTENEGTRFASSTSVPDNFEMMQYWLSAELKNGEILVKTKYLWMDPVMMERRPEDHDCQTEPRNISSEFGMGIVVDSKAAYYEIGDAVISSGFEWASHCTLMPTPETAYRVLKNDFQNSSISYSSVMQGMISWLGFVKLCKPVAGETLLVCPALSTIGHLVGQLAKRRGLRIVGVGKSDEECRYLEDELHCDRVINRNNCRNLQDALKEACPEGIDCCFDDMDCLRLKDVVQVCNQNARVAICGAVAACGYNYARNEIEQLDKEQLRRQNISVEAFNVSKLVAKCGVEPECIAEICQLLQSGKFKIMEHTIKGTFNDLPNSAMMEGGSRSAHIFEFLS